MNFCESVLLAAAARPVEPMLSLLPTAQGPAMDCAGTAGPSGRLIDRDVRPGLNRDGTAGRLGRRDHGVRAALESGAPCRFDGGRTVSFITCETGVW
jgi:hypothetical protein